MDMILRICLILLSSITIVHAINFFPLPKSFTNTIWVSPSYGVFQFKDLDLSSIGGGTKTMQEVLGIGLKWGNPFDGIGIHYQLLGSSVVAASGNDMKRTTLNLDAIKLRWHVEIVNDGTGKMALFSSLGQFSGVYKVETLSESNGLTEYKERLFSGVLADLGAVFGFELNPEWNIFLEALYQFSMNETLSTALGKESSDPMVDMTGTMIQIGSALRL